MSQGGFVQIEWRRTGFQKAWFHNGYDHLKSFSFDSNGVELVKLCVMNLEDKQTGIGGFFKPVLPVNLEIERCYVLDQVNNRQGFTDRYSRG